MKIKRINSGIYDVAFAGRHYELERYPDGSWLLFEAAPEGSHRPREYMNDFATKRAALAALEGSL